MKKIGKDKNAKSANSHRKFLNEKNAELNNPIWKNPT
jgi:hypothetical protein